MVTRGPAGCEQLPATTGLPAWSHLVDTASLQAEGVWLPCVQHVYRCPFPSSTGSLRASVSRFGNCHRISNFFIIIRRVMVTCDQ